MISEGVAHVIWEDQFNGWMYTSLEVDQWSPPEAVSFPFANSIPRFFPDLLGYIHALWIDKDNTLRFSRVANQNFGLSGSWEAQQTLASSAVDFDLAIDDDGRLHLAYVRILDDGVFPAGIYYRNSKSTGTNWSQTVSLFSSDYFRTLTVNNANVRLTSVGSGDTAKLFVAWDNRPRKRVLLSQSNDGGDSWEDPLVVDQPDPISESRESI